MLEDFGVRLRAVLLNEAVTVEVHALHVRMGRWHRKIGVGCHHIPRLVGSRCEVVQVLSPTVLVRVGAGGGCTALPSDVHLTFVVTVCELLQQTVREYPPAMLEVLIGLRDEGNEEAEHDVDEEGDEDVEIDLTENSDRDRSMSQLLESVVHIVSVEKGKETFARGEEVSELRVIRTQNHPADEAAGDVDDQNTDYESDDVGDGES